MGAGPSASTYYIACRGQVSDVLLSPAAEAEYRQVLEGTDEISVKRRVQLDRYFRTFCDMVHFFKHLSDQKFKNEGNFPDGKGGQVAVWTFKSWQWRVYGAILQIEGRRCFVGMLVDPAKKRDKADQKMLKNTAKGVAELSEYRARNGRR